MTAGGAPGFAPGAPVLSNGALRAGERPKAHEHLAAATTRFHEMDMPFWLDHAEAELKQMA